MTRAAYCPETINTIRANAKASATSIAAQLGWTIEELRRVAQKHSIELVGGGSDKPSVLPSRNHVRIAEQPAEPGEFDASMTIEEIVEGLPELQGAILRHLIDAGMGVFVPTHGIAGRFGTTRLSVSLACSKARKKLQPTRWTIEGRSGSGFRVVTHSEVST